MIRLLRDGRPLTRGVVEGAGRVLRGDPDGLLIIIVMHNTNTTYNE